MIRKVYCIEAYLVDIPNYDSKLKSRRYARNLKTANKIKREKEKRGYEVDIHDYTSDYKAGAPILEEWVEG